jgi:hypothetical protein
MVYGSGNGVTRSQLAIGANRAVDAATGVIIFAAAAAVSLVAPSRLNVVLTIDSPGANHVLVPIVYWSAVTLVAAVVSRVEGHRFGRVLARLFVVAFLAHMSLLLAASASWVLDRTAYSTTAYWLYGRAFYAIAIAATLGWPAARFPSKTGAFSAGTVAVGLAGATLAAIVVVRDPVVSALGVSVGLVGGIAVRRSSLGRAPFEPWIATARRMLADDRVVVAAAFTLALALRLLYTARVMGNPNYIETGPDARFYDRLAWSLVQGQSIVDNGYPLLILGHVRFLALLYAVFGHSYLALCIVQSLIGAAAAVGIYFVGKPVFGSPAARISAVFTAISFQLAFWAVAIGYQTLDIGLTMLLVGLLIEAVARWPERWWVWAIVGVAFGCAISVRETTAIFFAFVCGWLVWALAGRPAATKWRAMVTVAACAVIVLVPMVAPMVATPERRLAMRKHFDRLATGDVVPGREGLAKPLSDPDSALKQLRDQPGFVLRAEARAVQRNIAMQFFTQPYGEFDLVTLRKESDYYYGVWCYAYLLTAIGAFAAIRRLRAGDPHSAALAMILGVIAFRTLPHLYLESGYRHRAPLEPFLILLCAAGVMTVVQAAWPPRAAAQPTLQAAS